MGAPLLQVDRTGWNQQGGGGEWGTQREVSGSLARV